MKIFNLSHLSSGAKLAVFLIFVLASTIVFSILGVLFGYLFMGISPLQIASMMSNLENVNTINYLKLQQVFQSIGMFIFPPIMAHFVFRKEKENYLKIKIIKNYSFLILAGILMLIAIPFINFLAQVNQAMILPDALSSFAEWMKQKEADAAKLTEVFLQADHIYTLLINIFVVGLLPALGEEMLFRGVLQKIFAQMTSNVHWAIWITGFVFAAVHMQFYTFLPRFMMGVLFGYLFVWSGSLWITITAHFVNNSAAVIIHYLAQKNIVDTEMDKVGNTDYLLLTLSLILFSAIVYYFWKNRQYNEAKIIS